MRKSIKIILGVVIIIFIIYFFVGGGEQKYVSEKMQETSNTVADDAVKQYEIAKRQGDKTQIYVQAGMVCAAYLQAKDEQNYRKWKEIEKQAAKDAGMPEN